MENRSRKKLFGKIASKLGVKGILALFLSLMLCLSLPCLAFAEEEGLIEEEGGDQGEENSGEDGGAEEGGDSGGEEGSNEDGGGFAPSASGITTNIEGKYLSPTLPESELPSGFNIETIFYPEAGQDVQIATRTSKNSGEVDEASVAPLTVTIVYLTDADGSNGDFYLCDTTEGAKMSDMIKLDGKNGSYIIVLDPGDNVIPPNGFRKAPLEKDGKRGTAWLLPKDDLPDEEDEVASLFVTRVYADDFLNIGAGADNISEENEGDSAEQEGGEDSGGKEDSDGEISIEGKPEADSGMLTLDEIQHTNVSGLVQAQPKEFILLYAIDEAGNLGFYLYDLARDTYQRYVEVPRGTSKTLTKYRNLSRTRLFIMIILGVLSLILLFLFINTLLGKRKLKRILANGGYDEEDEEEEAMRQRVVKKEQVRLRGSAYADSYDSDYYGNDEEEEDDEDYEAEDESYEEDLTEDGLDAYSEDYGEEPEEDYGEDSEEMMEEPEEDVDWENMEVSHTPVKEKKGFLRGRHRDDFEEPPVKTELRRGRGNDFEEPPVKTESRRGRGTDFEEPPVRTESRRDHRAQKDEKAWGNPKRDKRPEYDLDDDFDYEFLNLHK